ncbi:hypothetical protein ACQPXH_30955 [Nocardia sp. CA-135953]|uniref:hypothetical protein n=1 Tax=Nocardia sp. CA-135953 TaxID=3239978 RepID=UPI003D96104F
MDARQQLADGIAADARGEPGADRTGLLSACRRATRSSICTRPIRHRCTARWWPSWIAATWRYLYLTDNDDYPALADPRPRWHGTLIANIGENREPTSAIEAEAVLGLADLVSFGRAFIANPDLVERITHDLPLASIREELLYGREAAGYGDYPSWDLRETRCA